MDNYNNDYNKDLYTAQSEDFCKSCYSSGKSRAGCLWALVAAGGIGLVYIVAANFVGSGGAAAATLLAAAAVAAKILRRKK